MPRFALTAVHAHAGSIKWNITDAGIVFDDSRARPHDTSRVSRQHAVQHSRVVVERAPACASSAANTRILPRGAARHLWPGVPGSDV